MANIVGAIATSHTPTIGFALDANKQHDAVWAPIFKAYEPVQQWLQEKQPDVLLVVYNDHVTSFFFDHYSAFALGVGSEYQVADEGGGARKLPAVGGHAALARHIGSSLMADEFDMAFFQNKPLDHGCFSPLSMLWPHQEGWPGQIIPLQVGVLQFPIPTARRCYKLGQGLRRAIESYPEDLDVVIVATGGLSHQVHGERAGFNNTPWDHQFLDLLQHDPEALTRLSAKDLARIYPDEKYPLKALEAEGRQRTPASIRETYRNDINKVMRKYLISSPVRMTHFLGEGAVECNYLVMMAEGSVSFSRKPTHESFQPEDTGFYTPKAKTDYLYYLTGRLGNIEEHDGPKFRGRGIKQLSGRENYGKYWVYRGWLPPNSFEPSWWNPSRPEKAPRVPDPQRLSINHYNAIDSGGWYWTAGSKDNDFKTINLQIRSATINETTVQKLAEAINGVNRKTQKPNNLTERINETLWAQNILMDDKK